MPLPCWASPPSAWCSPTSSSASRPYLPWNPQHLAAVGPDLAWNTAASFTTNTNWQSYTPESHHELSHRDGRPRNAQLLLRRRRHRRGHRAHSRHQAHQLRHHRQLLGRYHAHHCSTSCCPPRSIYALLLVAQGVPQNLHAYTVAHTLEKRRRRPSRRDRSLRRKPSRCWAPTAAASSTPTAPTRTRTPPRSRTSCRSSPSSSSPPASPTRWAA